MKNPVVSILVVVVGAVVGFYVMAFSLYVDTSNDNLHKYVYLFGVCVEETHGSFRTTMDGQRIRGDVTERVGIPNVVASAPLVAPLLGGALAYLGLTVLRRLKPNW